MNKWKVPLNKPFFSNETKELVMNVLNSGMVSQGETVEQFEEEVRKYVGAKYALAVSSCTAGMWMINKRITSEGETHGIPAFTFPAIHNVTWMTGIGLRYSPRTANVDVSVDTYNISREKTELSIGVNGWFETLWGIHQFGMPYDIDEIEQLGKEREIRILQDAACALGSKYKGKMIGSEGTAVFSFHGRKILTTGEGGMILTDDEELYERCLLMRQFGRSKTGQFEGHGLNFKMSDVAAAIGLGQMEEIETAVDMRRWWADEYRDRLMEQGIRPPYRRVGPEYETNYQSYVIDLGDVDTGKTRDAVLHKMRKTRDAVLHKMRANGIEAQVGSYDQSNGTCKNSARLAATTLALPIWPEMTMEDIDLVINALEEALV